eukprot:scaffold35741_cov400-Skeletonema_dohrnii-CCMP3373.AAC.1
MEASSQPQSIKALISRQEEEEEAKSAALSVCAGGLFETGILILRHEAAPLLTRQLNKSSNQ